MAARLNVEVDTKQSHRNSDNWTMAPCGPMKTVLRHCSVSVENNGQET